MFLELLLSNYRSVPREPNVQANSRSAYQYLTRNSERITEANVWEPFLNRSDYQNCNIWVWKLVIEKSSRSCKDTDDFQNCHIWA